MSMGKYFGTDGIRGKSPEWLNQEIAYKVGYALGNVLNAKQVIIGRDTRESGVLLNEALNQGARDSGCTTVNLGIVSTPMVQFLSLEKKAFGVMITASHNPSNDNGIKVLFNGLKTTQNQELMIEEVIEHAFDVPIEFEQIQYDKSYLDQYFNEIIRLDFPKTNIKVFLDTAHGSLSDYAKKILAEYCVIEGSIGDNPDGTNINQNVGSISLDNIMASKPKGMIGLAFDGDGDRLIAVDELGQVVAGDQILALINYFTKKSQKIVLTQMVNPGIKDSLSSLGIEVLESKIGDKYVIDMMKKENIPVGGEDSGHMIFNHVWPVGDGIISALMILKTLHQNNITLHEATQLFTKYPEKLLNFKSISKEKYNNDNNLQSKLNEIKENIENDKGKLLVRPSGTEDVIRVYLSHKSKSQFAEFQQDLIKVFEYHGGTL